MNFGTLGTISTPASMPLDKRRIYSLINKDGTDSIYLGLNGATPDGDNGENKYILTPGEFVEFGPGFYSLGYESSANTPRLGISSRVATASELAAEGVS